MKLFNTLILALSIITLLSCGPVDNRKSFQDVTEYNDFIIDNVNLIEDKIRIPENFFVTGEEVLYSNREKKMS
jgi:hypothetical protein